MLRTLKAKILGSHIEWLEASEAVFPPERQIRALVTPVEDLDNGASDQERAERRIAALRQLAFHNAFQTVIDPSEWQKGERDDRGLPDREA